MLKIIGTSEQLNDDNKPGVEVTTTLPNGYYLELSDKADNPYTVNVSKDVYDTINNLQNVLRDTSRFAG